VTDSPLLAIIAPLKRWGGIEGKLVTLCREFHARGIRTELVRVRGGEIPYPERLPPDFQSIDLGTRSKGDGVPAVARYLRDRRPDAVLTAKVHGAEVALLGRRVARRQVPIFVKVTNTLSDVARRRLKRLMIRRLYPRADGIIANSRDGAQDLVEHFGVPAEHIHVIYNPTVPPDLAERAAGAVTHDWLTEQTEPVILAAGRLTPQKDYATLIDALAVVRQQRRCRLIILGEGGERPDLRARAQALGIDDAVDLPGAVDDALPWMRRASVFAVSSRYEGLVNVLIEAMALGTPLVSTDCGGAREILEQGRLGKIVPTAEPAALAQAITQTLDSPGHSGQLTAAAQRFASGPIADEYLAAMGLKTSHESMGLDTHYVVIADQD